MNLFEAKFIIDGIEQESTLRELIEACNGPYGRKAEYCCRQECSETIIDENLDPDLSPLKYDHDRNEEYLDMLITSGITGKPGINYSAEARQCIAKALTSALWGTPSPYMLDSMSLALEWNWDTEKVGGYASLYRSVAAAADYAFEIGVKIASCRITCGDNTTRLSASCLYCKDEEEENPELCPVKTESDGGARYISGRRDFHEKIQEATVLYIPFDTPDTSLGGSALAAILGQSGESTPMMLDPDYFIDSYEVVKELKDDGIILAGREIGRGGLLCGLAKLAKTCRTGMEVDILPLQNSLACNDATAILFNETPGVLVAISDEDYGYIDTQMILQDIAYYPVGFATTGETLKIRHRLDYNVADLLLPLINRNL